MTNSPMLHQNDEVLLADESFINFCLGLSDTDIARWNKLLLENPDETARIGKLRSIVLRTRKEISDIELEHQIAILEGRIAVSEEADATIKITRFRNRAFRWKLAVASCVLLLAGAVLFYFAHSNQPPARQQVLFVTQPAQKKSLTLPDGSRIILNAASKVTLSADFGQKERRVQLDGEAYFDVAHDPSKPFVVETPRMDVKVLGTEFNVKAYKADDLFETSLIRGSVELSLKAEQKTITLRPHEKYVLRNTQPQIKETVKSRQSANLYSKGELVPVKIDRIDTSVAEVSWTRNKIVFIDEPLTEVAKKLERWYGVQIVVEDEELANNLYTGSFRNESLDDILAALQFSKSFHYQKQGNLITIFK